MGTHVAFRTGGKKAVAVKPRYACCRIEDITGKKSITLEHLEKAEKAGLETFKKAVKECDDPKTLQEKLQKLQSIEKDDRFFEWFLKRSSEHEVNVYLDPYEVAKISNAISPLMNPDPDLYPPPDILERKKSKAELAGISKYKKIKVLQDRLGELLLDSVTKEVPTDRLKTNVYTILSDSIQTGPSREAVEEVIGRTANLLRGIGRVFNSPLARKSEDYKLSSKGSIYSEIAAALNTRLIGIDLLDAIMDENPDKLKELLKKNPDDKTRNEALAFARGFKDHDTCECIPLLED